jgi:hypothetical protein
MILVLFSIDYLKPELQFYAKLNFENKYPNAKVFQNVLTESYILGKVFVKQNTKFVVHSIIIVFLVAFVQFKFICARRRSDMQHMHKKPQSVSSIAGASY